MIYRILCADIGGSNSRFGYFELFDGTLRLCESKIYATTEFSDSAKMLEAMRFGKFSFEQLDFVCIGVAGLIDSDGYGAHLTNAPLYLDFRSSAFIALGERFKLVNDFALQAFATLTTESDGVDRLFLVPKENNFTLSNSMEAEVASQNTFAVRGILGAGTGLGTAALLSVEKRWGVLQGEGGHGDMPFYGDKELDFEGFACDYLKKKRLSVEDVLCAKGLSLLHAYFHGVYCLPEIVAQKLWSNGKESEVLKMYACFLGRFCKNFALNTLCLGGLFLGGGVLMKNPRILESEYFYKEFYPQHKDKSSEETGKSQDIAATVIPQIPVCILMHAFVGVWGGACLAREHILAN